MQTYVHRNEVGGSLMNGTQAAPAGGRGGEPDAASLLSDLTALCRRTRADRQGYAFPLFLFGGLILLAPLLYGTDESYYPTDDWDPRQNGSNFLVRVFRTAAGPDPHSPTLVAWYWLATLVLGSLATAWWYRRRAERAGVETGTQAFLIAAGAAFAGFFLGSWLLEDYSLALYGAWTVNLPLILCSAAAAAVVTFWCTRPGRTPAQRMVGVFVAALLAATAFAAIGVYANRGFSALYVIAAGLLVLAWLERSVLLGVTGVLFTLTAVPATMHLNTPSIRLDMNELFHHLGWSVDDFDTGNRQVAVLQLLLLPAAILLIAGAVAALTRRRGA
jgi:hypothetical protein